MTAGRGRGHMVIIIHVDAMSIQCGGEREVNKCSCVASLHERRGRERERESKEGWDGMKVKRREETAAASSFMYYSYYCSYSLLFSP